MINESVKSEFQGPTYVVLVDEKNSNQGATYVERRIDEGHASMPITMSEHIRGVVIAIVMPSAVRGYTKPKGTHEQNTRKSNKPSLPLSI